MRDRTAASVAAIRLLAAKAPQLGRHSSRSYGIVATPLCRGLGGEGLEIEVTMSRSTPTVKGKFSSGAAPSRQCTRGDPVFVVSVTLCCWSSPPKAAIRGMDRRRPEFQLNVVRSRLRSVAGCLIVLKNNFAGTQAAEMNEESPLTYFCRSRGTCDVTSARSRQRRVAADVAARRWQRGSSNST